ncbi:hypothetical protein PHMEG_00017783 [Phytophthora megakarya]|uniref:Peptidase A2 domain-containing protein n=1 Tax=Phytophthora megakarya TaxID=4795 RepID=A0A225VVY3_9STRA|nr:hypothetical protein PHMEG_00017783 [Phytophthora megakarya]
MFLGAISTPEYSTDWYSQTLAKSSEAKRANRDFKGVLDEKVEMKESSTVVNTSNVDGVNNVPECSELERDVMRNVCAGLTEEKSRKYVEIVSQAIGWYRTIPFRWRSVVRQLLYGELNKEIQCCELHDRVSWICTKDGEKRIRPLLLEETQGMSKIRVSCLMNWLRDYYYNEAPGIVTKLLTRDHVESSVRDEGCAKPRRVTFVLSGVSTPVESEAVHHEYEFVPSKRVHSVRRPGIRAVIELDAVVGDYDRVVPEGKRVICSFGGFEALSGGFIDCCPSEMLVDSGAIASLVHERMLRRVGCADEPLRTYRCSLDSVSGHSIQVRGVVDLPLTLGSVEKTLPFVVMNHLHVDAILGTDTLRAFRAVIDLEEQAGEVVPLGDSLIEECYGTDIATTVKLAPGSQAFVRANVEGRVDPENTVLIEGIAGGDDSLCVARTLCTVLDGQVVVEICNTSTEELVITKDSQIAVAARQRSKVSKENNKLMTGMYLASASRPASEGDDVGQKQKTLDDRPSDEMKVEFHQLMTRIWMKNNRPGRTDLLKYKIDTGTHAPINSQPYRVSKVEDDVMEAELGQY